MRLRKVKAPNSSTQSFTPKANVAGQFETSLNPCSKSTLTRYALADHLPAGRISPVGTNQSPVSPDGVVVAFRVSEELAGEELVAGTVDPWAPALAGAINPNAASRLASVIFVVMNPLGAVADTSQQPGSRLIRIIARYRAAAVFLPKIQAMRML